VPGATFSEHRYAPSSFINAAKYLTKRANYQHFVMELVNWPHSPRRWTNRHCPQGRWDISYYALHTHISEAHSTSCPLGTWSKDLTKTALRTASTRHACLRDVGISTEIASKLWLNISDIQGCIFAREICVFLVTTSKPLLRSTQLRTAPKEKTNVAWSWHYLHFRI
jgi:hypothetical protein